MNTKLMICCYAIQASITCYSQSGLLDNTFDTDGMVTTTIGSLDMARSVAIQSDGKIVVVGGSYMGTGVDFSVVRYNSDGSLDTFFGVGGKVTTDVAGLNDEANSVIIQSDNKIVVGGYCDAGSNKDFALLRYNPDGSLDTSFGMDGITITDFSGSDDYGNSVLIQMDSKIILAGQVSNGFNNDFGLARYNSDGSLDLSFDTDGMVYTDFGSSYDEGYSVALQNDGKIILGGYTDLNTFLDFAVVRYNSNGSLDNSFDGDGKVVTSIGVFNDNAYSIIIQPDGKIVLGGYSDNGANNDFALVRYNSDGTLDNSFDMDGKVITPLGGTNDEGYSIIIQPDNKIIMAGRRFNGPDDDFALVRYNTDGDIDLTFDSDGIVTTDFGFNNDYGWSLGIQNDGKIILAGGSNNDFAVARYLGYFIGISENSFEVGVYLYPNPTLDMIFVDVENELTNGTFTLFSLTGDVVFNIIDLNGSQFVYDLSEISPGCYFVEITDGSRIGNFKVIKN